MDFLAHRLARFAGVLDSCSPAGWRSVGRIMLIVVAFGSWRTLAADVASLPEDVVPIASEGVPGNLIIAGGGKLPDEIYARFVELAGEKDAKLVVIPTAGSDMSLEDLEAVRKPWADRHLSSIAVLHTRSREQADSEEFVAPLKTATAVWIGGGQQSRLAESYLGTAVERELVALLHRGGVIGGTSAGAAIQSRRMIASGKVLPRIETGFDFLPRAVIDQHFTERNRKPRLLECLAQDRRFYGIGVDEGTAAWVAGRQLRVFGRGAVTICLAESPQRTARQYRLESGDVADIVALQRAAAARARPPMAVPARLPVVEKGSLVLGGGGRMPMSVVKRFVELAGGPDARIVVLPTAGENPSPDVTFERQMFERAGAHNVMVLAERSKSEVESARFLEAVGGAGGLWFGGGRQWRFVDAYEGTKAVDAFHQVLQRGGVIGGSSAGASIQADYLVRGNPLGNLDMMAEGYESGFCFLPGVAVDQHFSQRNRRPDMESLQAAFPQLLGIGIDESTALIVRGSVAEVHGEHQAWFFARRAGPMPTEPTALGAGWAFDLVERKAFEIKSPSAAAPPAGVEAGGDVE